MSPLCVFSSKHFSKCQPRLSRLILWMVFTNLICLKEVVSDCNAYSNATNAFNPTASGCLEDEQIAGSVQYPVLQLGSDPTVVAFRHENRWDHSIRMIYSFSFDTTLVDSSSAEYSLYSSNIEQAFEVGDLATFGFTVYYQPQGETEERALLSNATYTNPYIFENTFYFEIDPPLQVGPGVVTVYVQLQDYKWPSDIRDKTGSGYLRLLSCSNTTDCNGISHSWSDLAIEHEYYMCPGAYSDLLRAFLHCRNESLPARVQSDNRCGPEYPAPGGGEGECLSDGEFPCCSTHGWCGNTVDHCETNLHRDYRKVRPDLRCGPDFSAVYGGEGECFDQCCSTGGWCGNTSDHCVTNLYKDYRGTTSIETSPYATTQPDFGTTTVGHLQTTLQTDITVSPILCQIGWPVIDRGTVDTAGWTMVSPDQQLCSGVVTTWTYFGSYSAPFRAIIFRAVDGPPTQFKIVGINDIPAGVIDVPVEYSVPEAERITVEDGDVIGWSFGEGVIKFDCGGTTIIRWVGENLHAGLTNNQIIQFNVGLEVNESIGSEIRTYSINAIVEESSSIGPSATTDDFRTTFSTTVADVSSEANQVTQTSKTTPTVLKTTTMRTTSRVPVTTDPTAQLDQQLERLANVTVTSENVASVAENLTSLVAEDTKLDDQNLDNINNLLSSIVDVKDTSLNVTESVVVLVDDILDSYDSSSESTSDVSVPKAPNQIQRSLEKQITGLQNQPGNTTIEKDNIAIRAVKVPVTSVADDRLIFETVSTSGGSKLGTNSSMVTTGETPSSEAEVAISFQLPQDILDKFDDNETLPVSFIIYNNAKLFPSTILANEAAKAENVQRDIGSRIITANVEGITVVNLTSNPVQLFFTVIKQETNEKVDNIECVFWDNDASEGFGDWSDEGCELNETLPDGRVTCLCNHLTSFSVLVDRYGINNYILDKFSKIGCGVSIVCLVVTIVTYLSNRTLRSKQPQRIFLCFCCSLLCLYIVFVVGIERTDPQIGCIVVSALLHYLTMTSILWMAVEAFTMYINFVKVVGVHISKYLLKASLVAWGTPALIVVIIAIADAEQYRNDRHCFIRTGLAFYLTQVLLLVVAIAFNGYIFGRVMYRLTFGRVKSSASKKSEMKKRAQNALAISSLIGLTWVFGLLSLIHEDAALAFQILFCTFNSLQGLFVFTMFCLIKPEIQVIWKSWLLCQGVRDPYKLGVSMSEVSNGTLGKTSSSAGKDSKPEVKGHENIKWEVCAEEQKVKVEFE